MFHGEGRTTPNFTEPGELAHEREGGRGPTVPGVRSPEEYAAGHIPRAVNIPVGEVGERLGELPRDRPVVTYCLMGMMTVNGVFTLVDQ